VNSGLCLGSVGGTAELEVGTHMEFAYTADAGGLVGIDHQELGQLHKDSQLVGTDSVGSDRRCMAADLARLQGKDCWGAPSWSLFRR
jgi:hypothetical protein